jgi:hypothetical protein
MAYLAATDVTVTLTPEDFDRSPGDGIGFRTFPQVDYGDGVLQYPALGIPMPAIGYFGFNFAIKRVFIEQPANGFIHHFDRANQKLRIYEGSAIGAITMSNATVTGNVAAPANHTDTPTGNFTGDAMANHHHNFTGDTDANAANTAVTGNVANASAGTPTGNYSGDAKTLTHNAPALTADPHTHTLTGAGGVAESALAEMTTGATPAATTLYMEMLGR